MSHLLPLEQALDRQPLVLPPETPLSEAIATMSKARSSYTLIVQQQQLLGILTERDVVKITASKLSLSGIPVSQVMTENLVTLPLSKADDLFSVLAILRSARIRHLPITDDAGHLVGIVTAESVRAMLKPTDLLKMRRIAETMATQVITATQTTSVFQVAQLMATHRKSCVVICLAADADRQTPMGIITERDIVRLKASGLNLVETLAETVMSCPLLPLSLHSTLWDAHQTMQQHRIRRLVVVDEAGYLAGIVTQSSLLQVLDPVEMYARVELLQQVVTEKTQELIQMNQQIQQAKESLEAQVQARTLELTLANEQLAASNQQLQQTLDHLQATQEKLIQSAKMAALGQLIAEVTHEINSPLAVIRSSINRIAIFLDRDFKQFPEFFQKLDAEKLSCFWQLLKDSNRPKPSLSSKENRQLKRNLIRQLEAEGIENATAIADTLADLKVFEDLEPFWELLKDPESSQILETADKIHTVQISIDCIDQSVERASKIVSALKNYAHYNHSGEKQLAYIPDGLETVLAIYQTCFDQGVTAIKNYQESLPLVLCYPDELNQVWTNLIHNALQAMENRGTLTIDVRQQAGNIQVSIADSGPGIPPEVMPRLFDKFFTTKPTGKGSGLGLDIVKRIVDKHQGKIEIKSEPGKTTFTVSIPTSC